MKVYVENDNYTLYEGKMQDVLSSLPENSIDSIVCDPPYELNFMNKGWDNSGVAFQKDTWLNCLRVLKPGGYLLAFGGTRTYHRIACAIEDAGFEIRDTMMWLYGSGFPKSHNVGLDIDKLNGVESKVIGKLNHPAKSIYSMGEKEKPNDVDLREAQNEWSGWGTALKPAYEPIIVARKPISESSVAQNCLKWGVGGINIDECRVGSETISIHNAPAGTFAGGEYNRGSDTESYRDSIGRFPANVITDGSDEVACGMPAENETSTIRYFYSAKASKKDRDEGLDAFEDHQKVEFCLQYDDGVKRNDGKTQKNIHPTVKPVELMQYLVRLVSPKGATILDCFMGSGSTGKAVMFENRERDANYYFIDVEMTPDYLPIANARIDYALNKFQYDAQKEDDSAHQEGKSTIFDFID